MTAAAVLQAGLPMQSTSDKPSYPPAGLFTRLVAMFYDSLLLLAVLLIATALALLASKGTLHYHNPFFPDISVPDLFFLLCLVLATWRANTGDARLAPAITRS